MVGVVATTGVCSGDGDEPEDDGWWPLTTRTTECGLGFGVPRTASEVVECDVPEPVITAVLPLGSSTRDGRPCAGRTTTW